MGGVIGEDGQGVQSTEPAGLAAVGSGGIDDSQQAIDDIEDQGDG